MRNHPWRIAVCTLALVITYLWVTATPGAAVDPATVSGRVTDSSGVGIANVNVSAYTGGAGAVCCTWITAVNTDASGNYVISLAPGTYRIQFYPPSGSTFVSRWWSASGTARTFDQASDVALSVNTTLPDTALETGFLISGTVTATSGPLAGVNVSAYTAGACCTWVGAGVTSASGTYSFRVPTGSYRLQFFPSQTTTYIAEWWDSATGAASFDAAVDISVTADVTGRDAVLALGRRISGTVTDGTNPITGANASVFAGGPTATCCTWITGARTDASGAFSLIVPDATYRLSFTGPSGSSYLSEWWDGGTGANRFESATDIVVSADRTGLGAVLVAGFRISGRVTSDGTTGIAGAGAGAFTGGADATCCTWIAGAGTDAGGNYSFVVAAGTYRIQFSAPRASSYMSEWWDAGAGVGRFDQAIDVTVGSNLTMNSTLVAGVRISGRVTATDGGTGVARAGVSAFTGGAGTFCCSWVGGGGTDEQGNYSLVLPSGTYRLFYSSPRGSSYIGEWWNGGAGTTAFDQASDVTLTGAVTGQNVELASGILVSGRVTAASGGAGIAGVGVSAYTGGASAVCCARVAGVGTDALGNYSLVVPAGTYRLQFFPPRTTSPSYVGKWWTSGAGAARFDLASDIAVAAAVTDRNAALESGFAITGRVTAVVGGAGIAGAGVSAFAGGSGATCCTWISGTGTDSNGDYRLVVPSGNATYRIQFHAPRSSSFLSEWWNGDTGEGAPRFDQGADLAVTGNVSGKNGALASGQRITGRVTSDGSTGIAGVGVSAFTGGSGATCCTWVAGAGTDGLGNYSLVVPAGTYRVQFYPPRGSSYVSQWWTAAGGAANFAAAQDIAVSAQVTGKDAQLGSGLRITGRVTSGGSGVAMVGVSAYTGGSSATCCTWVGGTGTDGAGNYTLVVPAGTYRLQIWPPRGSSLIGQWWAAAGGTARFDQATDVAVSGDVAMADVVLASGQRITGRVTAAVGGAGLAGAGVSAFAGGTGATCCTWVNGTGTDSAGNYSLALPAGSYRLQFYPPRGSAALGQWNGGAASFSAAADITLGGSDLTANASLTAGVTISGTVSGAGGVLIQGAWVNAMICSTSCTGVAGASTGSNGTYSVAVPQSATYKLQVNPPQGSAYVGAWFGGGSGSDVVVATDPVTGKDVTLATGSSIRGTVTSNGTAGIANVNVNAQTCSGGSCSWVAGTRTASNGTYALVVPNGTYQVSFNPPPGTSYISQWYQNRTGPGGAGVTVSNSDVPNIDATLATGFAITGFVRDQGGAAIASANVAAMTCSDTSCTWVASRPTAADGSYRLTVPGGGVAYKININPPSGSSFVGEWYQDAASSTAAQSVTITNADRALDPVVLLTGFVITGTVTDSSAVALANARVSANTCSGNSCSYVAGANTGGNGVYRFVVPAATYKIQFSAPQGSTYIGKWYLNATNPSAAADVTVLSSQSGDRTLDTVALATGFVISGTVTSNGTAGIANVNVSAQKDCGTNGCTFVAGANTNSSGVYSLVVPANTTYKIRFNAPQDSTYLGEWYNDKANGTAADGVVVGTANVPDINATLATGFVITGTVRNSASAALQGAFAGAFTCAANPCTFVAGTSTNSSGVYRLVVPANTYKVNINAPSGTTYVSEWYQDGADPSAGRDVVVASTQSGDQTLEVVVLVDGFAISGTVSNSTGPLANANVSAHTCSGDTCSQVAGVNTASDGTYRLVVPTGASYKIRFSASTYVTQWHANQTTASAGTAITTTATGINATLVQ